MRKTILFISPSLGNGGAERMLAHVCRMALNNGYNACVYAIGFGQSKIEYPHSCHYYKSSISSDSVIAFFKRRKEIRKIIDEEGVDLICSFTPKSTKLAVLAKRKRNVALVSSERDSPYTRNAFKRAINGFFFGRSDIVVFQTNGAREAYHGKAFTKGIIIPNPAPVVIDSSFNAKPPKIFIASGRLSAEKGFSMLIDAFEIAHHKHEDFSLFIFGDGKEKDFLQKKIDQKGLSNVVFLKGWSENYMSCDYYCFILSSNTEGMPNVLIEAMANNIPCISTDCKPGGPRELLFNGEAGYLVPVDDHIKMAEAIIDIMENPEKRFLLNSKAKEIVSQLDSSIIDNKWLDVFEKAIALKNKN